MTTYASIKGQSPRTAPAAISRSKAAPADDLTPEEIERIAINRALVLEHMPELVETIRELHAIGLIDGWRSVVRCDRITLGVDP